MILVASRVAKKISNLPAPLGEVGKFTIFDDSVSNLLADVAYKQVKNDIKFPLAAKTAADDRQKVDFGGSLLPRDFTVIAGPCSAESQEQVFDTARYLKDLGVCHFRAGCFKPRTNAYSFQGLGLDGLKLCRQACDELDMKFVSEVKDLSNLDPVQDYADIIQVGSKCMYDVGVLRNLGQQNKPILLKRHFGSTLKEFAQAADFIMCEGNEAVVLCERGVRGFETSTRFSLDSCGIEWLKEKTNLPIIGDPSHAMGYAYGVPGLSLAMIAQQVSGLIIEVHPSPKDAKSDADQQLDYQEFKSLLGKILELSIFIKRLTND